MNIKNVKQALPVLLKNNICPFFWGSQGIGKTQTVAQYCAENKLELIVLHTSTQEVGDLIGLLMKSEDGKSVHHARPDWFPTKGKGIVFLDELNRAPNDVIQAMFPFITEGRLHTHILPPGWKVVAAGNYNSDRFTVTDTSDAAWMSRFCHIDFTPTVEEWLVYAESKGLMNMADFIREQPAMLELTAKNAGRLDTSFIVPDRRSAMAVGQLDASDELLEELKYEVYSGLMGVASAAAFLSWKNNKERSITIGSILTDYKKTVQPKIRELMSNKKEVRLDLLNQPIDELMVKLEQNPDLLSANNFLPNLQQFLLDIPLELSMKAFVALSKLPPFHGKNNLLNDPDYVNLFSKGEK